MVNILKGALKKYLPATVFILVVQKDLRGIPCETDRSISMENRFLSFSVRKCNIISKVQKSDLFGFV